MDEIMGYIRSDGLAIVITAGLMLILWKGANILLDKWKHGPKPSDTTAEAAAKAAADAEAVAIKKRMEIDATVKGIMERVILQTRADLACVCELHNGSEFLGGHPFGKISCTSEALAPAVESLAEQRQDMSMHLYSTFINKVCTSQYVVLDTNNRDDSDTPLGYEKLVAHGIALSIRVKVTDLSSRPIGYVEVDYRKQPSEFTIHEDIPILQEAAAKVGALLSVREKEGKK